MSVRYEIEEGTNAVKVFHDDATVPSLYQPHWPNGESWSGNEEADAWAKLYIASIEDQNAPFAPNARGEEGAPKPTAEQIAAMQAEFEQRFNPSA